MSEFVKVQTTEGEKTELVYNVKDFPYRKFIFTETVNGKNCNYYDLACTFDIETTTIKTLQDKKGKFLENPYGFMYHWQFCIEDTVCFGRTWEEFIEFVDNLNSWLRLDKNLNLVVYSHNLAFEFQFMKDFLGINSIDGIFAKDVRKPLKISTKANLEFRCSYFLSNMSLLKFCENSLGCIYWKANGDLDYSLIRTPYTILTNVEKGYCYNDVRGLSQCIRSLLNEGDTLATIPLTSTGYVRRDFRRAMSDKKNRALFEKLKLNEHLYMLCKQTFRGGNTHANRNFSDIILYDVFSRDISSSYPYVMLCSDEFPMSKFQKCTIDSQEKLEKYLKKYCLLMTVKFKNIKTNAPIPYIPISKCLKISKNNTNDNGRVLQADYIKITLTNIDLDVIRDSYEYDFFEIEECYYAKRGKLPKELREVVLEYFDKKTKLKDVDDKYYEYMKSKNKLNSTFGMIVSDIIHDMIDYKEGEWKLKKNANPEKALEKFYNSRNNFLTYQWGVWITAIARGRNLQEMIKAVGDDIIYTDTDSIKFIGEYNIKKFEIKNQEIKKLVENNDIRAFSERDGIKYYLGVWDDDGFYKDFKTLGAKKYCGRKKKKDKYIFEVTVAGMGKELGSERVGSCENFNIGTTYNDVGRTVSWYNEDRIHKITINGDTFTTASNIGVLETSYTLGVSKEYWQVLFPEKLYYKKVKKNVVN